MSILDCMEGKLTGAQMRYAKKLYDDQLAAADGNEALAEAEFLSALEKDARNIKSAKIRQAMTIVESDKEVRAVLSEETALQAEAKHPLMFKLLRKAPSYVRTYTEQILKRVDVEAEARFNNALEHVPTLHKIVQERGGVLDPDTAKELARGLLHGADQVKDPEIRKAVTEYRKWTNWSENSMRKAGLNVGHIDNYVPVQHNFAKIGKTDQEVWQQAMLDATDLSKVYNQRLFKQGVSEGDFNRITGAMHRRAKNGDAELATREINAEAYGGSKNRGTDLWGRHASNRIFHPKDVDAFVRYTDEYGDGMENFGMGLLHHMRNAERDVAMARIMSPMPAEFHKRMMLRAQQAGADRGQITFANGMFETAANHWAGSVDSIATQIVLPFQNALSLNLLGSAPLAAIADQALLSNLKRVYGLMDGQGRMKAFFDAFDGDANTGARMAEQLAYLSAGRFDAYTDEQFLAGFAAKTAKWRNVSHKWTGLEGMTNHASNQMSLILFSDLSEKISKQTAWTDTSNEFRALMRRVGITETDWQKLQTFDPEAANGLLTPNMVQQTDAELASKLRALDTSLRRTAVNAPDLFTRTISTGRWAGPRAHGDWMHLIASSVMQFKSFPVQVWRNHFVPAAMRVAQDGFAGAGSVSMLMLETLFFGMVALQLKQIAANKPIYDMEDPDTYRRAFLQGGALGLIGDIMLQDPDAYKASIITKLAGPVATTTEGTLMGLGSAVWAPFSDERTFTGAEFRNTVRPFVPLQSHWYFKAGMEAAMDHLMTVMDPNYYDTINRRQQRLLDERGDTTGVWTDLAAGAQ